MNLVSLKQKNILILGLGKEGLSSLNFLRRHFPSKIIGIADRKELNKLDSTAKRNISKDKNIKLYLGKSYLKSLDSYEIVFKSPGVIVKNSTLKKFISQTEIFIDDYRNKIIGITGTKGKSTTSSLIFKILNDAKLKVSLIGNIGNPALDFFEKKSKNQIFVYELSSYQLQNLKKSPHISVLLNIYEEHLNYHENFQNYILSKANITKWQTKNDFIIYNLDSGLIRKTIKKSKGIRVPFSLTSRLKKGACIEGNWIVYNQKKICRKSDTKLKGSFNLNNILASVAVAKLFNISNDSIARSIKTFIPLKHRLEYVGNYKGVDFYNDSIATIPEATIAALDTLSPKVGTLIVGGYDRGIDLSSLAEKIKKDRIANLVLFPETGKVILKKIKSEKYIPNYFFAKNMKEAVVAAFKMTKKGQICLLSPASSSFNLFKNYEDRGNQFIKEVAIIQKKK